MLQLPFTWELWYILCDVNTEDIFTDMHGFSFAFKIFLIRKVQKEENKLILTIEQMSIMK